VVQNKRALFGAVLLIAVLSGSSFADSVRTVQSNSHRSGWGESHTSERERIKGVIQAFEGYYNDHGRLCPNYPWESFAGYQLLQNVTKQCLMAGGTQCYEGGIWRVGFALNSCGYYYRIDSPINIDAERSRDTSYEYSDSQVSRR
jgi:hypothetical protein